ncbi:KAR9 family protein [Aspergillus affinis]|uniref:KAR9 family protein n=1 Tax=Aspergillus affinis TaxID=1070780 RepID=UPI0022FE7EB1|nr:KAR9-domain-containing protein [Aspergillus affinis]KAI9042474.1 KAR9-domain-containing protein [Aspergillus affinis]
MLAMFAGSTTSDPTDPGLNTSQELQNPEQQQPQSPPPHEPEFSSPPPPPPPALSVSTPDDSFTRRLKSKSSLRSVRSFGSSLNDEDPSDETPEQPGSDKSLIRPSILRRLSPGLAARVKLLDGSHTKSPANSRSPGAVGRIPEEHIKELDTLHQNLSTSIKVERKGRSWNALHLIGKDKKHQGGSSDLLEVIEPEFLDVPSTESLEREALDEPTLLPSETDAQLVEHAAAESPVAESVEPVDAVDTTNTIETTETWNPVETSPAEPEVQPPAMSVAEPLPASTLPAPVESIPETEPEPEPATQEPTDFEKYIQSTSEKDSDNPPPPPPKDSPPESDSNSAYFRPSSLHRADSIFSFSRASFSNQLSQLTSISLPQASSLASSIAAIPTAPSAVKSLTGAADQIQIWIKKATSVLEGLDADDDVEWAAAGGRDGLDDVDNAIMTFEGLINVYVKAIEDVQLRPDIENVASESLKTIVTQMDFIIQHWTQIKSRLRSVKSQVELAMEWEELWNNILGDVGAEVGNLAQLIFQMEEKRHLVMEGSQSPGSTGGVDINELETIVEETPGGNRASKRLSVEPIFNVPPTLDTPIIHTPQEDNFHGDLIGLFARIQPLRASLDFLPMRLSMFQARADAVFPSACQDLQQGIERLEGRYKMLEMEAEDLRKELSEDRWILVFRNAGGQAQKMFQSVERSIAKLQEALESGAVFNNPAGLAKRIESYEAKKQHYVAAIERVVSIIQKGVKDRLTLNGETLTLLSDMTSRLDALKASIKVMDASLDDVHVARSQHLRDSISSIVTMDSPATGSVVDTPGSSPASSVVMTPANPRKGASTPIGSSRRGSSVSSAARTTMSKVRRYSGLPQATATLTGKKSALPKPSFGGSPTKNGSTTPTPVGRKPVARPAAPPIPNRPRWNIATNTTDLDQYKTTPFRKSSAPNPTINGRTPRPSSTLPFSRSTRRDLSASPAPSAGRSVSRVSSRLTSRSPAPPPSPSPGSSLLDPPPYSKLRRPAGTEHMVNTPRNRQSFAGTPFNRSVSQQYSNGLLSPTKADRPGTALGHSGSRRISLLPLPKGRSGRDSAAENRSKLPERPRWR